MARKRSGARPRQRGARVVVPGTKVAEDPSATDVGALDPDTVIRVSVIVRPTPSGRADARRRRAAMAGGRGRGRGRPKPLTTEEMAALRGASAADVARIQAFAGDYGLAVADVHVAARTVRLVGTARALSNAFGATLRQVRVGRRLYRMRTGALRVPATLDGVVRAVLGFDTRPFLTRPARRAPRGLRRVAMSGSGGGFAGYPPPLVARMYGLPPLTRGAGQCIGIIEVNATDGDGIAYAGGYSAAELAAYWASLGIPGPSVTAVSVDGGVNLPGSAWQVDQETMLDIEVAGAVASRASIAVYFCPDTDAAYHNAFATAIYDDARRPSVISNSWGGAEFRWVPSAMTALDELFADAALRGVTVCTASGDYGSSGDTDIATRQWADFPASSPYALACGGTTIEVIKHRIVGERVWKSWGQASGGAVSSTFPRPSYQAGYGVPRAPKAFRGRGVPDVAADADYDSGYRIRWVDGTTSAGGGTSAAAPLWAAFIAISNAYLTGLGKPWLGFVNPVMYSGAASTLFFDVTAGNNDLDALGRYKARVGWDCCTGRGAPRLGALVSVLGSL